MLRFHRVLWLSFTLLLSVGDAFAWREDERTPGAEEAPGVLPKSVDLRPAFEKLELRQRAQGQRGTCSVFTTVEAVEFAHAKAAGEGSALSIEFANWAANAVTKQDDDGDFFYNIIKGLEQYGICPDATMPYAESFSAETRPTDDALQQAREFQSETKLEFHWIRKWSRKPGLSDENILAVKKVLATGVPVCAGSSHSVLFVGYDDEPSLAGGGRFLIADSNLVEKDIDYEAAKARFNDVFWVSATRQQSEKPAAASSDVKPVEEITGEVVTVTEGDIITIVTSDKKKVDIRFNGIDAPELGQMFGTNSKQFVSSLIGKTTVRVVTHGEDRYGRTIGDVYARPESGDGSNPEVNFNWMMVANGRAWHYVRFAPDNKKLADAEKHAREKKLGLWADASPIAPWDWRKQEADKKKAAQ